IEITLDGYRRVFGHSAIWIGYRNSLVYTVVGVAVHLALVLPCSYALSRRHMAGRTAMTWYILFTMLFSGGIVPTYLLVRNLGILDTMWAVILPGAAGAWSILVARAFFTQTVPEELGEAAKVDGASDLQTFLRNSLPQSTPLHVTLGLFHVVGLMFEYSMALITPSV